MSTVDARLLSGRALYEEVVLQKLCRARESVWISTANVKAMLVEHGKGFVPIVDVLAGLAAKGVALRLLHAETPSRPFRAAFEKHARPLRDAMQMRICPRVHFKTVLLDGAWVYLGSANLTGAGLGAKDVDRRNFEMGFATEDFDVIDHVTALFEAIWSGAECRACKLHDVCPAPLGPTARTTPRRRRRQESDVRLGQTRRLPMMRDG